MSLIRLYIDEDSQDRDLLRALCARTINVIAVKETKTEGLIDVEQLRLATPQRRVLYSHNIGDFCQLHAEFITTGENHSGIALLSQDYSVGSKFEPYWSSLQIELLKTWRINLIFSANT